VKLKRTTLQDHLLQKDALRHHQESSSRCHHAGVECGRDAAVE
jgi:hypothetical protein